MGVTLPTPDGGPPLECDEEVARSAVTRRGGILERSRTCLWMASPRRSTGGNRAVRDASRHECADGHAQKPAKLKGVGIDTPERWQGLERKVMVMVHPLSGVVTTEHFRSRDGASLRDGLTPSDFPRRRFARSPCGHARRPTCQWLGRRSADLTLRVAVIIRTHFLEHAAGAGPHHPGRVGELMELWQGDLPDFIEARGASR